jgi:succinate dehydrogenase / fumarate reductase, iron-sulfur subunit
MEFTLKVRRYDPDTGSDRLQEFTVDAPETATLLDVLDVVKDTVDGSLTYRKSCRMAVCGSCGMRMDGAAVLACKTPMLPLKEAGRVPVIAPMGNLPVIKDLVVDMTPFWDKFRAVKPWLEEDDHPPVKEWRVQQEELDRIMKEALCIQCGCCVSECNSMEADPDFLGPAALAKAARFVGDVRDRDRQNRLRDLNGPHGVWDCTRCYFCQERCPKGVDPRDAIAKLGHEIYSENMLSDRAARHAQVFDVSTRATGYLLETALVPYTDPMKALDVKFAMQLARAGKVPNPLRPHRAKKLDEVRRLHKLLKGQEAALRDAKRAGVSPDRESQAEEAEE